jgi:hypothetical protein
LSDAILACVPCTYWTLARLWDSWKYTLNLRLADTSMDAELSAIGMHRTEINGDG